MSDLTLLSYLVKTVTANYDTTPSDGVVFANGDVTINLHSANTRHGHTLSLKNIGTGSVNVITSNSELIDANSSIDLQSNRTLTIISNGSKWLILPLSSAAAGDVNNASYLNGHTEAQLNVNSALTANNANYLNTHSEAQLNVNSALTANNSTYAFGKSEGDLNVNSALSANVANSATYVTGTVLSANNADYLNTHTEAQLNVNSALFANSSTYLGGQPEANLHVNTALVANNATYAFGKSESALNVNSALASNTANFASFANSASYLGAKTEGQLDVNTALVANNATYAFGKAENALNVNSALTANVANNATYAFGKGEANLNVNSAVFANTANNSTYAFGKSEINLNVNNALTANQSNSALHANNSTYVYGKTEGNLNVNSALHANNSTYVYGKTEGQLNVNNALTANDASYLGGQGPAFYTNASNANTGTLPDARLSANVVRYETAQTQSYFLGGPAGANGNITFRALTPNDVNNLDDRWIDINRMGFGFPGDVQTTLAFYEANGTFVLTNATPTWDLFVSGLQLDIVGPREVTLPSGNAAANGTYFIYINGSTGANANLVVSTTPWSLAYSSDDIPVAMLLWNPTLTPKWFLADERHTCLMDRAVHEYLHSNFGTRYNSGLVLNGYSIGVTTNAALTFSHSEGFIADEDIQHTIPELTDPDGEANAYVVFYRANSTAYVWTQSPVPFVYTSGGYIQYDNAGTMTQGTGTPARYYNSYVVAASISNTAGVNGSIIIIPGRGEYTSAEDAYLEDPTQFDFTGYAIEESVIVDQLTWVTGVSYGTKGKVQLNRVQRLNISVATAAAGPLLTQHNALQGLQGGTSGQYYHLTANEYANGITANNANYLGGKAESALNVNSALSANNSAYLGGYAANTYVWPVTNAAPSNGQALLWDGANNTWYPGNVATESAGPHTLLQSNVHTDTTNGTIVRGDIISAQGASPTWTRLPIGANGEVLHSNGTEVYWGTVTQEGTVENANNATYLNGKSEDQLNVNSALFANNSTYAFGKSEGALNVNSALSANIANDTVHAFGKTEGNLNVNSALFANNSAYLGGETEGQLNVNSALIANNATFAFGKSEGNLNVNSALTANNSTYAFGKSEGALNVNSALTANNSTFAFGKSEGALNVNSALSSNTTNSALYANNASYLGGQPEANLHVNTALTSNNSTYAFGKTEGNLNVNNALTANDASYLGGKPEANLHVNTALTSNNSTYAFGKTEGNLNVNNALTANVANNSTYAFGKTEGNLNVNAALFANNSTYVFGKSEGDLNVNSAGTSNNAQYLAGKSEAALNVNSALTANMATYAGDANTVDGYHAVDLNVNSAVYALTANNADHVYGKHENELNVNNALLANNSTYAFGKAEGDLNANSANNAHYLGGYAANTYLWPVSNVAPANGQYLRFNTANGTWYPENVIGGGPHNLLSSSHTDANAAAVVRGDLIAGVGASPLWTRLALGANGSVLMSDGADVRWGATVNAALTANSATYPAGLVAAAGDLIVGNASPAWTKLSVGANGQVLTSNGSAIAWANAASSESGGDTNLIFKLLDNLGTSFNGSQTVFTLTVSGANVAPVAAQNLLLSLNGVVQQPGNAFTVSGNTVTFTTAPDSNSQFFGIFVAQETGSTAYGKAEADLNVNSAVYVTGTVLTANNSTFAFGKSEGALNVNSALNANNTTYVNGKTEGNLNVNSALVANAAANYTGTQLTLTGQPASILFRAANTANLTYSVAYAIPWTDEFVDTGNQHSTTSNTTQVVVTSAGYYLYMVTVALFEPGNFTNFRSVWLRKNGGGVGFGRQDTYFNLNNQGCFITTSAVLYQSANDYVEVMVQTSGGESSNCYVVGGTTEHSHLQVLKLF